MGTAASRSWLQTGRTAAMTVCIALVLADLVAGAIWIWQADQTSDIRFAAFSSSQGRSVLAYWGIPIRWWVALLVLLNVLVLGTSVIAAYLIYRARPSWFGLYLAVALTYFATVGSDMIHVAGAWLPGLAEAGIYIQGSAWIALYPMAYLFPTGAFAPRWTRWFAAAWAVYFPGSIIAGLTGLPGGETVDPILVLLLVCSCAVAQIYRYVKISDAVARRQARWVAAAFAVWFGIAVLFNVTGLGSLYSQPSMAGLAAYAAMNVVTSLTLAAIPAAVATAIARHRLFDIDPWISTALVYAILTAFVVTTYELIVGGIGNLVTENYSTVLTLIAGALISIAFGPIGQWVRRSVDRIVYGRRHDPYSVLTGLIGRLAHSRDTEVVAQSITDTVVKALSVPYAAITSTTQITVASTGRNGGFTELFTLCYDGQLQGHLVVGLDRRTTLSPADRKLILAIVDQSSLALYATARAKTETTTRT